MAVLSDALLARSPRVYLRVGESAGPSAVDASGNGRTGTYVGSPTFGQAGAIVGDGDYCLTTIPSPATYVSIAHNAALKPQAVTVGGWVKTSDTARYHHLLYCLDTVGWRHRLNVTTGLPVLIVEVNGVAKSVVGSTGLFDGLWHFLVGTYDGTTLRQYVDGFSVGTPVAAAGTIWGSAALFVGGHPSLPSNGATDDFFIIPSVLADGEVEDLHRLALGYRASPFALSQPVSVATSGAKAAANSFALNQPHSVAAGGAKAFSDTFALSQGYSLAVTGQEGSAGSFALSQAVSLSMSGVKRPRLDTGHGVDGIEAWITDTAGNYLGHLERTRQTVRHFAFSIERNKPGAGSFEYHRDTADVGLFALDNLLWLRYRGVTRAFVLEQQMMQLDEQEQTTGWFRLAGRGVLQLLADRLVWPDGFTGTEQPDEWTDQWRTITGISAGTALWTLIDETNSRFPSQIAQGTIETTPGDEWTQRLRFDTLLDVCNSVTAALGDVDMDGLAFNYYNVLGTDKSASIILEEGADVLRASRDTSKQQSVSWIIAEGVGEGVFAKIAVAEDLTAARRREAYLDAKDAANLPLLQLTADGALAELGGETDRIGLDLLEAGTGDDHLGVDGHYQALRDFGVGDWVRAIVPDANLDATVRVVALYFAETDDDQVRVSMDVNDQRTEYLLSLEDGNQSTARSIGVRNRQPQGQLVPFNFSGSGVFDTDVPMEVFFRLPSRVFLVIEVLVDLALRQFWSTSRAAAGATTASGGSSSPTTASGGSQAPTTTSGGGQTKTSTSGGSSSPTTDNGGLHDHLWASWVSNTPGGWTTRYYEDSDGAGIDLPTSSADNLRTGSGGTSHNHDVTIPSHTHNVTIDAHDHDVTIAAHTHTVTIAAHTHSVPQLDLVYGMFRETLPASWSVTVKVYELVGSTWTLRHTSAAITDATEELDLTSVVVNAGSWKLVLQSDATQPNGGRLGCDVWSSIIGAIQSAA